MASQSAADPGERRQLLACGLSHKTAPVELREQVAFDPALAAALLAKLREEPGGIEGALVSTCNRVELYVRGPVSARLQERAERLLAQFRPVFLGAHDEGKTFVHEDEEAARHLFRVASGLESAVLGEAQVLGQVKEAHRSALAAETAGAYLDRLFQTAVSTGKRVRAETDLGAGAASIGSAAVELATRIFGRLTDRTVLLLGAGENGLLTARLLAERRVGRILIANRTLEKAARVAEELGGRAVPWEEIPAALALADVVIGSTGAPDPVLDKATIERAASRRSNRPTLFIDIAVPRDIDPAAGRLDSSFLYNIDDLTRVVDQNLAGRAKHIPRAERIVDEELARFRGWEADSEIVPVIQALQRHFEDALVRASERQKRQFTDEEWPRVEVFVRSLIKKILHQPITRLKDPEPNGVPRNLRIEVLRDLFGFGENASTERPHAGAPRVEPGKEEAPEKDSDRHEG
ncbi:MAG: glutamyl-tRNA reductase [Planctomycetes bacterium]|nr:glutamyl-tRNA reductase [Planctomycetota bacterium]